MGSLHTQVEVERLQYPETRRDESVVDNYHGVEISDPYRWLEDPDTPEVMEFVEKQVKLTNSVLEGYGTRKKLKEKLTSMYNHSRYGCPYRRGNHYFYSHNSGLQAQNVLYIQENLEGSPEVLLDPNTLSDEGTVALATIRCSEDAEYFAFGLSTSGSDWITIRVMRTADREMQPDTISWVKFTSIAWTRDNKGFFYNRYPEPKKNNGRDAGTETNINLYHELYYHFLGTDQSKDILCWRDLKHAEWLSTAQVTEDGQYLILSIKEGCNPVNRLYYCDLMALEGGLEDLKRTNVLLPFQKLVDNFEAQYHLVANDGPVFTFRTNKDAPRFFVTSKDSTKIPMFIMAQKGLTLDWNHPALLYGYGGFGISSMPSFSVSRLVLARHCGAVVAVANIRGGGEYGEEWHKAGSLARKQNCFDDFISCGEYLIREGYTQSNKLCIEGYSNGGLLVAACINQRPDLFGCALAHVGVMDMLRFHKFTIGHAWSTDFGCADKKEEFEWLIKYSPLHNVRRPWETVMGVQYPSTLLLTADHDDRVVPLHSLKLLATLQYELCSFKSSPQTNPLIARIDTKAGHGAGHPTQKLIDEMSDAYSFLAKMTAATWSDDL